MSDTEWVYSMYIKANPVPDPAVLSLTEAEGDLVVVGEPSAGFRQNGLEMKTHEHAATQQARHHARWYAAAVAFTVVVLIGAVFGLVAYLNNDGPDVIVVPDPVPTDSFDGQTATYTGPSTFDRNALTFVFDNGTDRMVGLGWNVMNDESITFEDEIAWMDVHRGDSYEIPPWVEEYGGIGTSQRRGTYEATAEIPDGKVLL